MLDVKKDRLIYGDTLIPEDGFVLEKAVGTTYGLNLETLVSICITLGLSEDADSMIQKNGAAILQALTAVADKLLVFTDATHIRNLSNENKLINLLDTIIIPMVAGKNNQNLAAFHPKVWVAEYINKEKNEKMYRLVVMSRNISFDRSYDIGVAFNGYIQDTQQKQTEPLINFLQYLRNSINDDIEDASAKKASMDSLMKSLKYVKFYVDDIDSEGENISNEYFEEDIQLMPIGIGSNSYDIKKDPLLVEQFDHMIIMSPFLDSDEYGEAPTIAGFNQRIKCKSEYNCLFTRVTELDKIKKEHVNNLQLYVLDPDVVNGESRLDTKEHSDIMPELDIHAKMYFLENAEHKYFFFGSLNCSRAALNTNVEFLVRLKPKFNYKDFYRYFLPYGEKNPIFVKENVRERINGDSTEKDRELEQTLKKFCRLNIFGAIENIDGKYSISLFCADDTKSVNDLNIYIKPLSAKDSEYSKFKNSTSFSGLELHELSYFFNVKVGNIVRIFSIPLKGMLPAQERKKAIIHNIHIDSKSLMTFIFYFLSGDVPSEIESCYEKKNSSGGDRSESHDRLSGLFEVLLKAAANTPEKIDDINKWLINYKSSTENMNDESSMDDAEDILKIQNLLKKISDARSE